MKNFRLAVGPANCGKTDWAVEQCINQSDELSPVIVLLPSQSNIAEFKKRVLDRSDSRGLLNVHFHTFYSLVKMVADHADLRYMEVGKAQRRILLESFLSSRSSEYATLTDRTLTRGFYSAVLQYFSDLEDGGVTAELAGKVLSNLSIDQGSRLLIELHKLYITFSHHLESAGYLSRERLFIKVFNYLCKEPRRYKNYRFIVDGFYDFNMIQRKILETFLQKIHSAHVTLMDGDTTLFHYTNEAGRWLQNQINRLGGETETLAQHEPLLPDSENLFSRDLVGSPTESIRYVEASSPAMEIQETVRSAKKDLISGAYQPHEIAITYRGGEEYYNGVINLCRKEEIPLAGDLEQPLLTNPALSALLEWFDVLDSDFSRTETVDWLLSGYINPPTLDTDSLQRLSRKASVLDGRDEWVPRLKAAAARLTGDDADETFGMDKADANRFQQLIPRVDRLFSELPVSRKQTWISHIADLRKVMKVVRFPNGQENSEEDFSARDERAIESFHDILDSLEQLADDFGFPEISSADFAVELRKILQDARYVSNEGVSGGMTVGSVPETRGMHWRKVYLMGVIDEVFPVRWRSHALVKIKDRMSLNRLLAGDAAVVEHGADLHEERLIFYIALTRATEQLVVSTVTGSEQLLPSPFYEELRRFYSIDENAEYISTVSHQFRPDNAWLQSDLLQHLAQTDLKQKEVAGLELAQFAHLLHVRKQRIGTSFSEYDGRITSPDLLEEIKAGLFNPERAISPSALETYYESPFQYFCRYLLKLEEIEEVTDELPPAERGLILHTIMERFYQSLPPEFGGKVTGENLEASRQYLTPILKEVFSRQEEKGLPIPELLWDREKRLMEQYIWNAVRFFATNSPWKQPGLKPDAFEFSFGMDEDTYAALQIPLEDNTLYLRGRADRLDLNPETGEFTAVDYKTSGGKKVKEFYNGRSLQLPVYAMAAVEHLQGYTQPLKLSYYSFRQGDEDAKVALDGDAYDTLRTRTLELLDQALFQITAGQFHPSAGICNQYCPFKHMCRCEENRIRKKSV